MDSHCMIFMRTSGGMIFSFSGLHHYTRSENSKSKNHHFMKLIFSLFDLIIFVKNMILSFCTKSYYFILFGAKKMKFVDLSDRPF